LNEAAAFGFDNHRIFNVASKKAGDNAGLGSEHSSSQPMEANPYSTPSANLYGAASGAGGDAVSPSTIAQLTGTKPWVRFMSVLMWIGAILLVGAAAIMLLVGSSGAVQMGEKGAFVGAGAMAVMALYYGVMAFVIIYPAMKMWKYANSIGRLAASHSVADLDAALAEQRRYWKFNGIMIIILMCLAVVGLIAGVALGVTAMKGAGVGL
jgi:hypothetical protein